VLVGQKEFLTDTGGPGRQRGGLGLRMSFRALDGFDGVPTASIWQHGQNIHHAGLKGGSGANVSEVYINDHKLSREERLDLTGALTLDGPQKVISYDTTGGGGFGYPDERDPVRVREDVRDGLVSIDQAARIYGVVIDPDTLEIDEAATLARRRELRAARQATASPISS
jgi:N-methylhydantoinase B/oxoprolinase/acetone carboxylase alpha subunit